MELMDFYRAFHLKAAEYTFVSGVPGTFSWIDHMLGHKASLGKFKKTGHIKQYFYHNALRLETNDKQKTAKNTNMWRLNNVLLSNQWVTEEIKGKIKKKKISLV